MNERLATAINGIRADSKILNLDEAGVRARVIDPIFGRLGWETFDQHEFKREYPVAGGRVDYALLVNGYPKVFIEAKSPREDLRHHEDQLVTYSAKRGVPLAVLTNGLNWWLYLPLKEGDFGARQFWRLDLYKMEVSEACDRLIEFLARENVHSGAAVKEAEAHLKQLKEARKVDKALPRAWQELIAEPDELLVELINEKVKGMCGIEATPERIKGFLAGLGKPKSLERQLPRPEKKKPAVPRDEDGNSIGFALSALDNIQDKDLMHALLSDIIEKYINASHVRDRGTRANVKEYMANRGFIEFEMLAEWGGVKSDRRRLCKVDICDAQHAINRRT